MSNVITEDTVLGNAMSSDSAQFLILPYHSITSNSKGGSFQRNFKNFSKNNFLSDLKPIFST